MLNVLPTAAEPVIENDASPSSLTAILVVDAVVIDSENPWSSV